MGARPSFAWRSIFKSRELLQEGLVWRVGNGESIKIWEDKWLPSPISYIVQSPIRILPPEACVSALIDPITKWWDYSLIQKVFNPEDASRISSLTLSPSGQPDRLVWIGNSNGKYSVKSAYHLEKERLSRNQGECSMISHHKGVWQQIWQLNMPGVVRNFLWRVCTNSLPHKENLFKRKVLLDSLCLLCGRCPESTVHIL